MMRPQAFRFTKGAFAGVQARCYSSAGKSITAPRHFMSISDLTPKEFAALVKRAAAHKNAVKAGQTPKELSTSLAGKTVAMTFSKRSTRTRVSTEAAVALMGGHPMFLGKDDIQLGVNESLLDTSKVISSMTSCMVARVGPHSDVTGLAEHSAVPVINALSDERHPLQTVADFLTIHEQFPGKGEELVRPGLKVAWIGDSNNVLFDLAMACVKSGVDIAVASPESHSMDDSIAALIKRQGEGISKPGRLTLHTDPRGAIADANILVTDTWVSMGQEAETKKRLRDFAGFQITEKLAESNRANPDWKFMHCLPRHPDEVDDQVFYGPRSLVFPEAENRLWAAVAVLEAFVVDKGKIL